MTDELPAAELPELPRAADRFGAPDPGLQRMATLANTIGTGPNVTLFLPAGVLSGTVIPVERFFELLSESQSGNDARIRDLQVRRRAEKVTEILFTEPAKEHTARPQKDAATPDDAVRYIHLERCCCPAQVVYRSR
ncbi:hypothetical protein [Nocardia alni]|uniref:hypothetical protein n=1 Tax=Nocardia alni TaxID=2815723 RepID=UPI001C23974C|nr:hypothetical protein [Nocardia alni]